MMRRLRRWLDDGRWPARAPIDMARHRAMFDQAFWLVRIYYALMLFIAFDEMAPLWNIAVNGGALEPLWPVFWATDTRQASLVLIVSLITSAFLAVLLPDRRWPKILVFLSFLSTAAYRTSFAMGSINHGNHFWIWLGFCFCFLPSGAQQDLRASLTGRYRFLMTFWHTQALILLFYTMSGFWKLAAAIEALLTGRFSALHPDALAQIAAWKMLQIDQATLLGPILAAHPWIGFPAHLWVIYVELFALLVLFRPALHRTWGAMLIAFHIGAFLLLGISFVQHVVVLTILFVWSPFQPLRFDLKASLESLPGVNCWARRWRGDDRPPMPATAPAPGRAVLVYDGDCVFCDRYVAMLRLRKEYDLKLVNARDDDPMVDEVREQGLNLDRGMVLKIDDRYYHGDRSLNLLALMSAETGLFSRLVRFLFGRRRLASLLYPILAAGRGLTLWLLARKKLGY